MRQVTEVDWGSTWTGLLITKAVRRRGSLLGKVIVAVTQRVQKMAAKPLMWDAEGGLSMPQSFWFYDSKRSQNSSLTVNLH